MKTQEELNALKEEAETVNRKLHELTDEELAQVTGGETGGIVECGVVVGFCPNCRFELRAIYEHATYLFWEIKCKKCGFYNNQGLTHEQVHELYG